MIVVVLESLQEIITTGVSDGGPSEQAALPILQSLGQGRIGEFKC